MAGGSVVPGGGKLRAGLFRTASDDTNEAEPFVRKGVGDADGRNGLDGSGLTLMHPPVSLTPDPAKQPTNPETDAAKQAPEQGHAPGEPWSGFPAALVAIAVFVAAVCSGVFVSRSRADFGAFLALLLVSLAGGSFVGFLVGGPGLAGGDDATQKANERGWADRLGVFGNWITGAAFVLVVAHAGDIADWFSSLTGAVAERNGDHGDTLYQYAVGSWMIASASLGFMTGFTQMVTTVRKLIGDVAKAEAAAEKATAAADTAVKAAEAVKTAVAEAPPGVDGT